MYANIIVDISVDKLDRPFQYHIPEALEAELEEGMVVTVPFGKGNRQTIGYVIERTETPQYAPEKIKDILAVKTSADTAEARLIALAAWMRRTYGSTMIQALKTVLPMKEKINRKQKRSILLKAAPEEAIAYQKEMQRKKYYARARVVEALLQSVYENHALDYTYASQELGCNQKMLDILQKDGIITVTREEQFRNPLEALAGQREGNAFALPNTEHNPTTEKRPSQTLMPEQQEVIEKIRQEWSTSHPRPCLLHGVTGSGKTIVYMELIEYILSLGQQVIVLIPEIALTFQTVSRFYQRFGNQVSVINSRQSAGERYDQICRAKKGEVQIMIGPRSALFTPFPSLGLIIIDEEHEHTYKSELSPRYHAREVAIHRARMEGAKVLLGSATPSLEAYTRAKEGGYALFTLQNRYEQRPLPSVEILDMKEELRSGNRSILSRRLAAAMKDRLQKGEQSILFLNRRGYAGFVSCRSCGFVLKCPHCDVALTEHRGGRLLCHYCGYQQPAVKQCPECGSPYIGGFKAGTQQIQELVQKEFPEAKVLRMDYDTTRKKGDYEEILEKFSRRDADILIGTQMIVKGHDFPAVTLVGVLAAELSLYAENYRSAESTFQLICQAVGRSGRGERPGEAIIQTYSPGHYSIQAAARQDYEAFYQEEITYRRMLRYPPASCMMAILAQGEEEALLREAMEYLKKFVLRIYPHPDLQLIGPADQAVGKINDQYRMVLYLKHQSPDKLIAIKDKLEKYIQANTGFQKLYIQFDFDTY